MNVLLIILIIFANAVCYGMGYRNGVDDTIDELKKRIDKTVYEIIGKIKDEERNSK